MAGHILVASFWLAGCDTVPEGISSQDRGGARHRRRTAWRYYIGRRYKPDFKFWNYVRRPGQLWSTAQLVMLNEKEKLRPIARP